MGRLDRLELHNFKSYGGDVVVGPFKGFTAVIGTNGSGKSNLMDAISFVLGVRTSQLRGNQLRDLVYRNLEDPSDDVSQRRAHVKLFYRISDSPVEEVEFMRSVTISGASEYRVRGRVVSLENYNTELASIGVLVKARNFLVFQNEVEGIAAKSPKDLAKMFEDVSESAEFREQYENARVAKDTAEDDVTHFWRKRKGMAAEKRQYREQKQEAERYQKLQKEIAHTRMMMVLFELYHVDIDLENLKVDVANLSDDVEEKERHYTANEAKLKSEKERLSKLDADNIKLEKKRKRFYEEIEKLNPKQVQYESEISSLLRRIKGSEADLTKHKEKAAEGAVALHTLERDLEAVREQIKAVEVEIKEAEEASISSDSMTEYRSLKDKVATRTAMFQQELDVAVRNFKGSQSHLAALEQRETQLRDRVAFTSREVAEQRARGGELESQLRKVKEEVESLKHQRAQLLEVSQERESVRRNLEQTVHDTTQALRDAKADITQSTREEAFNRAYDKMRELFPGVHGRLSDLCQPTQNRYREAIAVVFGKNMDAIVIDNSVTGTKCIQYLKDQRVGVATFIPLAEIRGRPVDESLRRLGGTAKLAIDVLKHDDFVINAVQFATGNAVVCDSLDEARYLRYECGHKIKICSLDGTLINKAGFMTGGISRGETNRARKWDRGEIEVLKKKRQSAIDELEKLGAFDSDRRAVSELMDRIEELQRSVLLMENDRSESISRSRAAQKDEEQCSREIELILPQIEAAKEAFSTAKSKVETLEKRLHGLEKEMFGEFGRRHDVETMQQFEEQFLGKIDRIREKKLELETKESNFATSLKYQKSQHARTPASKLEAKLQAFRDRLERVQEELQSLTAKKSELESRTEAIIAEIGQNVKSRQESADRIAETRQDFRKEAESVSIARKRLEDKRSKKEQLMAQRRRLLINAKVSQVAIPIRNGDSNGDGVEGDTEGGGGAQQDEDGDTVMVSETPGEGIGDDEGILGSMVVDDDAQIDYTQLSRRHRAAGSPDKQREVMDGFADDIKTFEQQLDRLTPNLKAGDHMTELVEKLTQVEKDSEAARDRARDALSTFEDVKRKRQERFNRCFNHVAGKINEVYKELTKSATYPMGGTAYLSLEQHDEPYLGGIKYNTMPPTKRFRDMDQLSGGERTVAALALLFAIHDFRPSPFFVLDEVDAALDKLNVGRVSRYVQSRAPDLQTIVISLKDSFFERADALVGIYRDFSVQASRLLTLDLTKFPEEDETQQSQEQSQSQTPVGSSTA